MPIVDAGLVIQYLALGLGVTGVVLSLSYPQTIANKLRLKISSGEKSVQELVQKMDELSIKVNIAASSAESVNKNIQRAMRNLDDLNTSIDKTNGRIDKLSKEMITANYNIKKDSRELEKLADTVQDLSQKMKMLDKSGSEFESEISKLGKVTLWAEKNVKELKDEVKHVKVLARNGNHRTNGKIKIHNGNGRYGNGNGNGNGKHMEDLLVKEKAA